MRYLPLSDTDRADMLARIGVDSIDDLFADIPAAVERRAEMDLPPHQGELHVERQMNRMAARNLAAGSVPFFCGAGAYRHHIPASVDHIIQRSEFLTSYTPYQPEIAQGTLQYLFEFQTQVATLTGMEVANASMYDGATATAEAVLMACRITGRKNVVMSGRLHPHYADVVTNMVTMSGGQTVQNPVSLNGDDAITAQINDDVACVIVQNPDFFGNISDYTQLAADIQAKGALLIMVVTEIMSLGVLKTPAQQGADIVAAEGQSIGNGLNFGGPYLGLFATRQKFLRQMPGRLCGQTVDADGKTSFVLTLSTREQHIRRARATSNICTNSGLCALAFSAHMTLLGGKGLRHLAQLNHQRAIMLAQRLQQIEGVTVVTDYFFNEFTVKLPCSAADCVERLAARHILAGVPISRLLPNADYDDYLLVAATETVSHDDIEAFACALEEVIS